MSNAKIYSNMEDGIPIIPITGSEHPPIGYFIPNDNYKLEISNIQYTSMYVSFVKYTVTFSINRKIYYKLILKILFLMETKNWKYLIQLKTKCTVLI